MLKKVFDAGNPLMQALATAADLLILNLLTLLCSIPIVTVGAAYTALNDMCIHIVRKEENYILKPYFKAFAANLKHGILFGILCILAAGVVYCDYRAAELYFPLLRIPVVAVGLILLAIAIYAFALFARYDNSFGKTLKNAASLAVAFFPRTLGMLVCIVGIWILAMNFIQYALPFMLMFGLSLPCYVCILLMNGVFDKLEQKPEGASGDSL